MTTTREQGLDQAVFQSMLSGAALSLDGLRDSIDQWCLEQYSHAELRDCLDRLRSRGCEITSSPDGLHRMHASGLGFWEDYLRRWLSYEQAVFPLIRVYRETSSTQDVAKTFSPGRSIILADHQTAGRGRLGRSWMSEPGANVLLSVSWPTSGGGLTHDRVSVLAGVAVGHAVLDHVPDADVKFKWPNDVMIGWKKLAGVLIEVVNGAYIIGIGMNVRQPSGMDDTLKNTTTSLSAIGFDRDRLLMIRSIAGQLGRMLNQNDAESLHKAWRARAQIGRNHTFEHHGQRITGQVLDLDPDHGLIVRRDTGELITLPAATTSVVV